MSTFLHPEAFLCSAGITQAALQTLMDGKLIAQGWQRVTYDNVNFISDFIPPSGETIGDGVWKQITRLYYNTADISLSMYDFPIVDCVAQMGRVYEKTGGAVANALTLSSGTTFAITASCATSVLTVTATAGILGIGSPIFLGGIYRGYIVSPGTGTGGNGTYNLSTTPGTVASTSGTGQTVSTVTGAIGSAGSTAKDNLYALWVALMQSADANFTRWNYVYMPGDGGVDCVLMECKTISATLTNFLPNANVNYAQVSDVVLANSPTNYSIAAALFGKHSVTIDRTNSFYVYMSIFSRSFKIGIKTTSSYFGWMFASYVTNADAVALIPPNPSNIITKLNHINEGFYGIVSGTAAAPSEYYLVRTPSATCLPTTWSYTSSAGVNLNAATMFNACGAICIPGQLQNYTPHAYYSSSPLQQACGSLGMGGSIGFNKADICNIAHLPNIATINNISNSVPYATANFTPAYLDDIFVAGSYNTDGNEVTVLGGLLTLSGITLAANLDDTTAYATILLNTVTGLPTSGINYVIIDTEVFSYTGVSGGNTLTGVTRAYNATPQKRHFIGAITQLGGWFVKLNGGFAFMGNLKPLAS